MNVLSRPHWTVEQFLEWEERQPTQHEFDGTNIIDMNGSTIRHQIICGNLLAALHRHFQAHPGMVLLPTQIRTGRTVRYPDIAVTLAAQGGSQRHVVDPVLLFEVLSESTRETDLTNKLGEYTGLGSVQRYVVVSQDEPLLLVHHRDGERWVTRTLREGSLGLPEIGASLPVIAIYAGVTFDEA